MDKETEKQKQLNSFLKYSSLAIQMVAAIGFAAWVGYRLDQKYGTSPILLVSLILVVFSGLLYQLWLGMKEEK